MDQAQIERILSMPDIPTLPAVAIQIIELTQQPNVQLSAIATLIEHDPAMSTKVLRLVNSSYYGLNTRCGSIQQALAFLGLQTVKSLVLGFSLARSMGNPDDREISFNFLDYWRRSLYSAAAAREIALRSKRCDPDEVFVAALIQDIGMVVLWRAFGDRYLQIVDSTRGEHLRLRDAEWKALQVDHAEIGALLLERWRFPEHITAAVRAHHASVGAPLASTSIAQTVALANEAAAVLQRDGTGVAGALARETAIIRYRRHADEWFSFRPGPTLLLLQTIANRADDLSKAFLLETGGKPDVDALLKQAKKVKVEQRLPEPEQPALAAMDPVGELDALTGLPDKHAFHRELESRFSTTEQDGSTGLLLIGLDGMRAMNETLGDGVGDSALSAIAATSRDAVGRSGTLYRFIGAEIVAIVPNTNMADLCRLAEHMRRRVAESPLQVEHSRGARATPMTVTIGASLYERESVLRVNTGVDSAPQLMRAAMFALASGRSQGRNRVVFFRREMQPNTP